MTNKPCPHLEELLPKESGKSVFELTNRYIGRNVDKLQPTQPDQSKEKAQFIARISGHLAPIEADILVLKYVYNEPFAAIAKELKLIGVESVIRIHDEALKKLRNRIQLKN